MRVPMPLFLCVWGATDRLGSHVVCYFSRIVAAKLLGHKRVSRFVCLAGEIVEPPSYSTVGFLAGRRWWTVGNGKPRVRVPWGLVGGEKLLSFYIGILSKFSPMTFNTPLPPDRGRADLVLRGPQDPDHCIIASALLFLVGEANFISSSSEVRFRGQTRSS